MGKTKKRTQARTQMDTHMQPVSVIQNDTSSSGFMQIADTEFEVNSSCGSSYGALQ